MAVGQRVASLRHLGDDRFESLPQVDSRDSSIVRNVSGVTTSSWKRSLDRRVRLIPLDQMIGIAGLGPEEDLLARLQLQIANVVGLVDGEFAATVRCGGECRPHGFLFVDRDMEGGRVDAIVVDDLAGQRQLR